MSADSIGWGPEVLPLDCSGEHWGHINVYQGHITCWSQFDICPVPKSSVTLLLRTLVPPLGLPLNGMDDFFDWMKSKYFLTCNMPCPLKAPHFVNTSICVCVCAHYLLHTHTPMSVQAYPNARVCSCLCYISPRLGCVCVSVSVCVRVCVCECDLWLHRHSLILPPVVLASFLLGPSNDTLPAATVCITGTNEP